MRNFYLFLFSILSFSSSASHLLGGEIYWKCNGNGQYIFYMDLYRECGVPAAGLGSSQTLSGPNGGIALTRVLQSDISPGCFGILGISCGTSNVGMGAIEINRYESAPISLTGTPTPSGWLFSWSSCCRPSAVVNGSANQGFFLGSKMYPGPSGCNSSPYFAATPEVAIIPINKHLDGFAHSDNVQDSLFFDFFHPQSSANTPISYSMGYNFTSPFPNNVTDTANGAVSINHQTGLINLDANSFTTGLYTYGVKVQQWRNNILLSEIFRDFSALAISNLAYNNPPNLQILSANFNVLNLPRIDVFPGDTVLFQLAAQDQDYHIGNSAFQVITFNANGKALNSSWGGTANYIVKPQMSPVSSQPSYTSALSNRINFSWHIGHEHAHGKGKVHRFQFSFTDNACSINGVRYYELEVHVKPISSITKDSVSVCEDDSIRLVGGTRSGTYTWSPSNGLSSTSVAMPMASPASSQYYYLTDPANPGFMDSVYVNVTPKGTFNLSFINGQLSIGGTAQTVARTWFYNGIPFNYPLDTLTPFGLGSYYVVAKEGSCIYYSDTVTVTSGMSLSVVSTSNGSYNGVPTILTSTLGVTFEVDQAVNVRSIYIPGLKDLHTKTGGYDLNLKVYDNGQNQIFNQDLTLTKPIDKVLKIGTNLNLMPNTGYTLAVTGDTAYAFSLYENMTVPTQPYNVGFTVKALVSDALGQFPSTPTNLALPFSLGIDKTVNLDENELQNWTIFPNPAHSEIQIIGLSEAQQLDLMDINGKSLRSITLERDQKAFTLKRNGLPNGLYMIQVISSNGTSVQKVVFD